jgi:hypothetical protein
MSPTCALGFILQSRHADRAEGGYTSRSSNDHVALGVKPPSRSRSSNDHVALGVKPPSRSTDHVGFATCLSERARIHPIVRLVVVNSTSVGQRRPTHSKGTRWA